MALNQSSLFGIAMSPGFYHGLNSGRFQETKRPGRSRDLNADKVRTKAESSAHRLQREEEMKETPMMGII